MPRDPQDELDTLLGLIDAEHAALKRQVAERMENLTRMHRRADELRAALGLDDVVIEAPVQLRIVDDNRG